MAEQSEAWRRRSVSSWSPRSLHHPAGSGSPLQAGKAARSRAGRAANDWPGASSQYAYPPVRGRFARVAFRTVCRPIGTPTYCSCNSRNLVIRIDSTQEGFTPNKFASRGPKRAGRRSFPLLTILMLRDTLASQDPLLPSGREPPCTRGRTNSVTVSLSRCPTIGHRRALPALLHT